MITLAQYWGWGWVKVFNILAQDFSRKKVYHYPLFISIYGWQSNLFFLCVPPSVIQKV